jgi:MYXO-CTERM domain-containing protein
MIRTVPIPTTVNRMGCAPGAGCCEECGGVSGPPIGAPSIHVHAIPSSRNTALHASLGDVQCDQDGNCYTDGVLTSAPLTTGPGCPPGVPSCSSGPSTSSLIYMGVGLLAVLLLEGTSRRR